MAGAHDLTHASARARIIGAALLFSTGGAAIKACTLSGWQVAGLRSLVAALAILVMVPAARRRWNHRVLLAGCAYAATMILFVTANKLTTAANTIFLQSTAPLYLLLLSPWLLKEHLTKRDLLFMLITAVGMACFFIGTPPAAASAPFPLEGNVVALLSGAAWGLTVLAMRWLGRAHDPSDAAAMIVAGNVIAACVSAPFALPLGSVTLTDLIVVLYLGVFQIALAYVLLTAAMRHVPALEASLLLFIEPVLNPLWAYILQDESPGGLAIVGGAIILAATAWRALGRRARRRDGVAPPDGRDGAVE